MGAPAAAVLAGTLLATALLATALLASPAGAQEAPVCGQGNGSGLRATLEPTSPLAIPLGRRSGGSVSREVQFSWPEECAIPSSIALAVRPGVLSTSSGSLAADKLAVTDSEFVDRTVRLVLEIDRGAVDPGLYEGTVVVAAEEGGAVMARGLLPVSITRQEGLFAPRWYWSPFVVLLGALLGGLVFGWWRATALAGTEGSAQRWLAARNLVAFLGAMGAGIAAWSVQYLQNPAYRLDAPAVLTLFGVVATPVATALLTFLKPDVTRREPA